MSPHRPGSREPAPTASPGAGWAPGEGAREPQLTPEEQAQASRAQTILYIVMAVFILAPLVVAWLLK